MRLLAPISLAAALVLAQGSLVMTSGQDVITGVSAAPQALGAAGEGGSGAPPPAAPAAAAAESTALDGSAGIAHVASITAIRSLTATEDSNDRVDTGPAYSYPVRWGTPISGRFGEVSESWPGGHAGLDFNGDTGDAVYAATDGRVTYAEYNYGGYGNLIMIIRRDGTETRYAHLSKISVKQGERVNAGDLIGRIGNTGDSSGSHLHFEVRVGSVPTPTDPEGLWTGPKPGIPGKPPKWACAKYGC